jgi:MFS family permease
MREGTSARRQAHVVARRQRLPECSVPFGSHAGPTFESGATSGASPASPRSRFGFGLPRGVWILGWVSLATDTASEAIYPLLPFFLIQVLGAGVVSLGVIEGAAEAINSLLTILSGQAADRLRSKRWLVLAGYAISSLVRPLIALARTWSDVFTVRLIDRVGKGIRGAPRDAMLAGWGTPDTRGRTYGFHRAMDHAGAVLGPVLAAAFLFLYPGQYRTLFALAIVPGVIAVALVLLLPAEAAPAESNAGGSASTWIGSAASLGPLPSGDAGRSLDEGSLDVRSPDVRSLDVRALDVRSLDVGSGFSRIEDQMHLRPPMPRRFWSFMSVLSLFMLGNSTDAFLLLKLTDAAGGTDSVPLMWAALHVVKSAVSALGGRWSDRIGRRAVIAVGWIVYAVVYAGFAIGTSLTVLIPLFLLYGCFFGFTEGTEKALVADLAPESQRGFAFGVLNAVQGLGALTASIVFGLIWVATGPAAAFFFGAAIALLASALLFIVVPARTLRPPSTGPSNAAAIIE